MYVVWDMIWSCTRQSSHQRYHHEVACLRRPTHRLGSVEGDTNLVFAAHLVCARLLGHLFECQDPLAGAEAGILDERSQMNQSVGQRVEMRTQDGVQLAQIGEGASEVEGESVEGVCIGRECRVQRQLLWAGLCWRPVGLVPASCQRSGPSRG